MAANLQPVSPPVLGILTSLSNDYSLPFVTVKIFFSVTVPLPNGSNKNSSYSYR
jgi:hypothetical protein